MQTTTLHNLPSSRSGASRQGRRKSGGDAGVGVSARPPVYLRPASAAEYLAVSVRTLQRIVARGGIRPAMIGGCRIFKVSDLDRFMEESSK
jgi:excisionase family DNA binding protein